MNRPLPSLPASVHADGRDLTVRHGAVRALVAVATVAGAVAVAAGHRSHPLRAALLAIVVLSYGVLADIDLAEQRLPNRITLPLAAATALAVVADGIAGSGPGFGSAGGSLAVGLGFAAVLFVMRFGMGDVKLALTVGTIAGWFGRDAVLATAMVGSLAGAAVALIVIIAHRRRDVTFGYGPCLAIGSVAGMLVAGA